MCRMWLHHKCPTWVPGDLSSWGTERKCVELPTINLGRFRGRQGGPWQLAARKLVLYPMPSRDLGINIAQGRRLFVQQRPWHLCRMWLHHKCPTWVPGDLSSWGTERKCVELPTINLGRFRGRRGGPRQLAAWKLVQYPMLC